MRKGSRTMKQASKRIITLLIAIMMTAVVILPINLVQVFADPVTTFSLVPSKTNLVLNGAFTVKIRVANVPSTGIAAASPMEVRFDQTKLQVVSVVPVTPPIAPSTAELTKNEDYATTGLLKLQYLNMDGGASDLMTGLPTDILADGDIVTINFKVKNLPANNNSTTTISLAVSGVGTIIGEVLEYDPDLEQYNRINGGTATVIPVTVPAGSSVASPLSFVIGAIGPVISSLQDASDINVYVGTNPTSLLPATVVANMSDSTTSNVAVTWDAIAPASYASAGIINLQGTVAGTALKAKVKITVNDLFISSLAAASQITVNAGTNPTSLLPATVVATYNNSSSNAVSVVWDSIPASSYAARGTFTVLGTVAGTALRAQVSIKVNGTDGYDVVLSAGSTIGKVKATILDGAPNFKYQIWSLETYTPLDLNGASDLSTSTYWRLVKGYDDAFTSGMSFEWEPTAGTGTSYNIYVRVKDTNSGNLLSQKGDSFSNNDTNVVKLQKVMVDGTIVIGNVIKEVGTGKSMKINAIADGATSILYNYYYVVAGNKLPIALAAGSEVTWDLAAVKPGSYSILVEAYEAGVLTNADSKEIKMTLYTTAVVDYPVANNMTVGIVGTTLTTSLVASNFGQNGAAYVFSYGEPLRDYKSSGLTQNSNKSFGLGTAYGKYAVYGYVRSSDSVSNEDGILKFINYARPAATLRLAVTNSANTDEIAAGTLVTLSAVGTWSTPVAEQIQYSFWRQDARGWVLVKDWSAAVDANVLNWKPTQTGNYTIQVRAKGINAGSYEASKQFTFKVTGADYADVTNISISGLSNPSLLIKRTPILLTANATVDAGKVLLYRFETYDVDLGTTTIRNYSADNTCSWIPRKAGNYKITVRIRSDKSFGYYDATFTTNYVTVS